MGERELLEELATLKAEAAVAAQREEVSKAHMSEIGQVKAEQARLVEAHEVRPSSRHLSALGLLWDRILGPHLPTASIACLLLTALTLANSRLRSLRSRRCSRDSLRRFR